MDEVIFVSKKKKKSEGSPCFSEAREPLDSFDYVNMYGTYNIQPTADREDEYPAIAQGLSRREAAERERARQEWKEQQAAQPEMTDEFEQRRIGRVKKLPNDAEPNA